MDLSTLSDEELMRLYQEGGGASAPAAGPTDLTKLSDEELAGLYKAQQPSLGERAVDTAKNFRLSNILKGIYDSAVSAATLPGDVYSGAARLPSSGAVPGSVPFGDPESAGARVADLGMMASPVASSSRAAAPQVARTLPQAAPLPARIATAQSAEEVGMNIPRVATLPPYMQKVAAGLSDIPLVGAPLQRMADRSLGEAEEALGRISGALGTADRQVAGEGIQGAVRRFKEVEIPRISDAAYDPINKAFGNNQKFVPAETIAQVSQIRQRLGQSAGELKGEAARVQRALEESKGQMTFEGLKDLRSALGGEMADKFGAQGYDDFVPRSLYATLSKDMEAAAQQAGGQPLLEALRNANATTAKAWEHFERIKPLGKEGASPNDVFERVFNMAFDKRANLDQMNRLKKTLPAYDWENVAAMSAERLAKSGVKDDFSMPTFINNWEKMNPSAKAMLFGPAKRSLDDMNETFKALQGIERFKSKSQSGNVHLTTAGLGSVAAYFVEPMTTVTAVAAALTGHMGARWMAKPLTADAMAKWSKALEIYVRRPSAGTAKMIDQRSRLLGATVAAEMGAPQMAGQISQQIRGLLGPPRPAGADEPLRITVQPPASGDLQENN